MAVAAEHARQRILPPSIASLDRHHLVDTTLFYAPTSGGVRRYLIAKRDWLLRHTGLRHSILVPGCRDTPPAEGLAFFRSPRLPLSGGYRIPVRLQSYRRRLAELRPDLLEVGDPWHTAWQARSVARDLGIPAVAFCHSDVISLVSRVLGTVGRDAAARYLSRLYAGFDSVLAPSQTVADHLDRFRVRNVVVQPLGVDIAGLERVRADPEFRRTLGIPPEARLLVFAGRLSVEKRIGDLRQAVRRLGSQYHLLLVGASRRCRAASNVTLLEYQQDARNLARILACCDVFVHAGDQETFGLVALEAMACGLPVVAADHGALAELVDEAVGATFTPRDADSLADAITGVFDRDLRVLGAEARARAAGYSWDRAFTGLMSLYARLLHSHQ